MTRILVTVLLAAALSSQVQNSSLRIEQVMTPQEIQETGVGTLSLQQRNALNRWLLNYTVRVLSSAQTAKQPATGCTPAIETTMDGEFNGWEGETIFKLANGQIWQQAEYSYTYSYSYRPDVTIYQTRAGCRLKVEDEDETILVKRIK